jgi:hypothetical protein
MFDPGALPWNQFTYGGRLISTSAGTIGVYSLNTFDDQGAEVAGLYGPRFVALSAHVLDRDPFGNYESLTTGPDAVTLSGWSIDPDTGGPNDVDVWIDDSFAGTTVAGNDRDDVGASFPDYGPDHGFSVTLPVAAGSHSVCAYSINLVAGRSNRALGCRTATVGGTPVGNFESLAAGPDQVSLSGWALDPDTSAPIHVDVWIDGHFAGTTVAVDERDDVGASFPEFGSDHGFTVTLPVGAGTHSVCAYAINMGSGSANRKLSCRTATVGGNPKGNLESVTRVGATVTASGWALDPDTADPITVHVYVDSHWAAGATAGGSRADVGAAFPGYGSLHGFGVPVTVSAGSHTVCAYAINSGAGNTNTKLGCRSI